MLTCTHQARVPFALAIRHLATLAFAVVIIVLLAPSAFSQAVSGTISGTVTDPNGAVVAGAAVTLENDQTKDKRDQVTNDAGRFSFAAVHPGVYTLTIE